MFKFFATNKILINYYKALWRKCPYVGGEKLKGKPIFLVNNGFAKPER